MSYEIVKSMSIKKDGRITMSSTSNNVQPRIYETLEILDKVDNLDGKLRIVFEDLINGIIKFQPSSKSKVHYGFLKVRKWLADQEVSLMDLWYNSYNTNDNTFTEDEIKNWKDKAYDVFKKAINEKVNMSKKEYAVSKDGYWIRGLRKYGYTYSSYEKLFTLVHAMAIADVVGGEVVKL